MTNPNWIDSINHSAHSPDGILSALWVSATARNRKPFTGKQSWKLVEIDPFEQETPANALQYDNLDTGSREWLITDEDVVVLVSIMKKAVAVWVGAETSEAVLAWIAVFRQRFQPVEIVESDDYLKMDFWALDSDGDPIRNTRKIATNKWHLINENYDGCRSHLDQLHSMKEPDAAGKLILWHGPPGTGKTNCVRSLAHAWRDWCRTEYVIDPDRLFHTPHYMLRTLVLSSNEVEDEDLYEYGHRARTRDNRWRLIVIEDAGEFIRKEDAKQEGQGLARLLNITDGLIGQGLKLMILITTNEPVSELAPAVVRPGRCLARIEFDRFSVLEANKWLARHGHTGMPVSEPKTLAELYEVIGTDQIQNDGAIYRPGVYV